MAAPKLTYRLATPSDSPQVHHLIETAFRSEDIRPNWTADMALGQSFSMPLDAITSKITNPAKTSAVIMVHNEENGDLVATFIVTKRSAELARFALFSIDGKYQRQRLGRRILEWAEGYCALTWGVGIVDLNALNTREELIKWYERCGYMRTQVKEEFPYEAYEGREGVPEGLHFVVLERSVGAATVGAGEVS